MQLFKYTIVIQRPRRAVFEFFADLRNAPLWRQYVRTMHVVDDRQLGVGSRVRFTMDLHGEEVEYELTVLAYEPPALWRHRTNETDFNGYVEYRFDDAPGNATQVTFSCVVKPRSLVGWLAMPQLWLSRNRSYRDQLPRLKQALEEDSEIAQSTTRSTTTGR